MFDQLHGKEISYNNLLDIDAAVALISDFDDTTVAILKHNNACGVAVRPTLLQAFGVHNEFISSGRLDDLSMCYAGLEAILSADLSDTTQVLAIFDNEETGSQTKQGAASPFLAFMLKRIGMAQSGSEEAFYQAVERAFMISADNAHAWHPNYPEKYDPTNHPMLGGGPVIKFNAAQKYASDAASAAVFASLCERVGVPCTCAFR